MAHSSDPNYGDNTYPGRGKLKCGICMQPLRDHDKSRPCSNPPADIEARREMLAKRGTGARYRP